MTEPTTKAGRALLADLAGSSLPGVMVTAFRELVLAIEAEARQSDDRLWEALAAYRADHPHWLDPDDDGCDTSTALRVVLAAGVHPAAPSLDVTALAEVLDEYVMPLRGLDIPVAVIAREYQQRITGSLPCPGFLNVPARQSNDRLREAAQAVVDEHHGQVNREPGAGGDSSTVWHYDIHALHVRIQALRAALASHPTPSGTPEPAPPVYVTQVRGLGDRWWYVTVEREADTPDPTPSGTPGEAEYTPGGLRYPTLDELNGGPIRTDLPMLRPTPSGTPDRERLAALRCVELADHHTAARAVHLEGSNQ